MLEWLILVARLPVDLGPEAHASVEIDRTSVASVKIVSDRCRGALGSHGSGGRAAGRRCVVGREAGLSDERRSADRAFDPPGNGRRLLADPPITPAAVIPSTRTLSILGSPAWRV